MVHTSAANQYLLTAEELEKAITPRTRVLILNSPNNPTGAVYSLEQLQALVEVLAHHPNIWVISDELYEHLVFDGVKHTSIATLSSTTIPNYHMKDHTLVVNGFSKGYVMTGFRLGWIAGPSSCITQLNKIQGQITSAPSTISQWAALEALKSCRKDDANGYLTVVRNTILHLRAVLLAELSHIPHLSFTKPLGAFYLLVDVSFYYGSLTPTGQVIGDADSLCVYLLDQYKVALVPGSAFGAPNCIRFAYASSEENVKAGSKALKECLASLNKTH